jgi:extracellular factor (EF) 3-hydroxypalmitic acid methyl ester biosynthesis protein
VDFIAGVADLRIFLKEFKEYLETPKTQKALSENPDVLEHIYTIFYPGIDEKMKYIDKVIPKLNLTPEETSLYQEYYQKHLHTLFLISPFIHRIYFKPSGYPGDYEMINMVHRNALEGETPLGKLLNKYATSIPIAQAVRKRTEFFTNEIKEVAQKNGNAKVLSIASGPALEFDMLLKKYPKLADNVSIKLLDQDIEALRFSQENLYKTRIETQSKIHIDFIHQNIGNYLKELNRSKIRENFDIVYASGLFDYFDFKTSKFVIKYLLKQTRPGGKIIIANLSLDGHYHKTFLEFVGEWYLIYRSREDMVKLSEAIPKGIDFKIKEIENGLCRFIEIQV